jgi:hypothetical protein
MTATEFAGAEAQTAPLETVIVDGYRDIHKGIRNELFGVTFALGSVDPESGDAVARTAGRFRELVKLLISHAEHEDEFIQPLIELHAPRLAEVISRDHPALEGKLACLEVLADRAVDATRPARRLDVHRWYLGMASFTAEYLQHQAFEEMEVMPALSQVMTPEQLVAVNQAIVASIPPDETAFALSLMLPAMNVEDRVELLGGMQAGAPPEVFAGVLGLAESVLDGTDYAAVATRLAVA